MCPLTGGTEINWVEARCGRDQFAAPVESSCSQFRIAETIFFARIGTGAGAIVGVSPFSASARSIFENALSVNFGFFAGVFAREKNMALSFNERKGV